MKLLPSVLSGVSAATLAIALTACSGGNSHSDDHDHSRGDRAASATPAAVVEWPNLRQLDDLVHHMEADVESKAFDHMRRHIGQLRDLVRTVGADAVPTGTGDPAQVAVLQAEMLSLVELMPEGVVLDDSALENLVKTLHPAVLALMEAAGMPHVHHDHDHDH